MKSINVKRRKLYLDNLQICKDILIQQINIFPSQINNLENKVKLTT